MRQLVGTSMTAIVHHQCPVGHILGYEIAGVGEGVASGRLLHLVGIPHDFLHVESRSCCGNHLRHIVGVDHVGVVVSVVTHHHHGVLPYSRIGVLAVFYYLIHQQFRLGVVSHWQSAHSHVGLSGAVVVVATHLDRLRVVEHAEEVV